MRIDTWFFSFRWGMNEKNDVHILLRPPYNVHVGFVIHTSTKRKKKKINIQFLKKSRVGSRNMSTCCKYFRKNWGMNEKKRRAHFSMAGSARHTMCTSVLSFIPQRNEKKNRHSILKKNPGWGAGIWAHVVNISGKTEWLKTSRVFSISWQLLEFK